MDRYVTLADVVLILRLTPEATYRLVRSGELLAIRIPARGWLVETAALAAYLRRPPRVDPPA